MDSKLEVREDKAKVQGINIRKWGYKVGVTNFQTPLYVEGVQKGIKVFLSADFADFKDYFGGFQQ